jgi:hypothetical protein
MTTEESEKLLIDCVALHKMRKGMAEYDAFMFAGNVLREHDAAVAEQERERIMMAGRFIVNPIGEENVWLVPASVLAPKESEK